MAGIDVHDGQGISVEATGEDAQAARQPKVPASLFGQKHCVQIGAQFTEISL